MLKYIGYQVVLQEVPDEISLAINISGCPHRCEGCHSKYLWEDDGEPLLNNLDFWLDKYNDYISCVCFMGGDQDEDELIEAINKVKRHDSNLAICLYTGSYSVNKKILKLLDYIKIGPYIENLGGLNNPNTNQKMYEIYKGYQMKDITYKFRKSIDSQIC